MILQGNDYSDDQFDQLIEEATPFTRLKFAHFAIAGCFLLAISGCRDGNPNYAQQPVELTPQAYKIYSDYLSGKFCGEVIRASSASKSIESAPDCESGAPVFFISDISGHGAYVGYCPSGAYDRCKDNRPKEILMRRCRENFGKCFVIDEEGYPLKPISKSNKVKKQAQSINGTWTTMMELEGDQMTLRTK